MAFAEKTRVPVIQTRGEIERLLQKQKAASFATAVDHDLRKARVEFRAHNRHVRFVMDLPDPGRFRGERLDQEERRIWRALLLVIKAKLEAVESKIESFEDAFLAQVVMPNGATVAEVLRAHIALAYETGTMPKFLLGPAPKGTE